MPMLTWRALAVAGTLPWTLPALAQSQAALNVVDASGFVENYESHVDRVIAAMTDQGLMGAPNAPIKDVMKLQGAVRRHLLEDKLDVAIMLAIGLEQDRSDEELRALHQMLAAGASLDDLPPQVAYSIEAEIYDAMLAPALAIAKGSGSEASDP